MGFGYASQALTLIVADHNGLTKEEIFKINEETYRANLHEYFYLLGNEKSAVKALFVELRDGRYYLKENTNMEELQSYCKHSAQIGYNHYRHKPSFWKGEIQAE